MKMGDKVTFSNGKKGKFVGLAFHWLWPLIQTDDKCYAICEDGIYEYDMTLEERGRKTSLEVSENDNKKETKKQIVVDEKLKELEKKERENYNSRSWRIITSDGFYNWG